MSGVGPDVPRQVSLLSCLDVFVCRTCLEMKYFIYDQDDVWGETGR